MAEFALARQPRTVLDLGCGEGHFLEGLLRQAPSLHVTGVDVEPVAAERCRARLAGHHAEILCRDLFDFLSPAERDRRAQYDVAVCGDVLYYLPPKEVARLDVPGIASLLSAGGSLVVSYADVNDHAWSVEVFRSAFKVEKEVYIKPVQEPPPWPWMAALLTLGG
jgi:2-polyprenyl-3-methyl-5-hydroxy-6-metoxy-1,4-benzoquinol methylase